MALGRTRGTNASYQMYTHGDTVGSKNWLEKPWTTEDQMGGRVQVAARRTVDQNRTPKNTVEGRSQPLLVKLWTKNRNRPSGKSHRYANEVTAD
ncbi:hypothetical protein ANN_23127 [Periplaneta americana]|uniref:Uncharacterized protein n=1 Tax=Periplaneta americana TaxID=6978 RepID=A0ABQ8SM79_PERAM|nr:hypothetical protein ANN_23127 [Periplaneta americana]